MPYFQHITVQQGKKTEKTTVICQIAHPFCINSTTSFVKLYRNSESNPHSASAMPARDGFSAPRLK